VCREQARTPVKDPTSTGVQTLRESSCRTLDSWVDRDVRKGRLHGGGGARVLTPGVRSCQHWCRDAARGLNAPADVHFMGRRKSERRRTSLSGSADCVHQVGGLLNAVVQMERESSTLSALLDPG